MSERLYWTSVLAGQILILLIVTTLTGCAVPETRECLVELNGACLEYDFSSSRNENPLGNTKELIERGR